jgi:hypothetical protein
VNSTKIHKADCVVLGDEYSTQEMISNYKLKSYNFVHSIQKPNKDYSERVFNHELEVFRSKMKKKLVTLGNTFEQFKGNKKWKSSEYILQMKLSCLLLNVNEFIEITDIDAMHHHKLWLKDNFDYPSTKNTDVSISIKQQQMQHDVLTKIQRSVLLSD